MRERMQAVFARPVERTRTMSRKKNAKKPKTNDVVSVLDTAFNTPSEQPWLVYKFAGNGGLVFQSVHDALYDEAVHGALEEARTWGEFRRLLPAGEWEAIAERLESREEFRVSAMATIHAGRNRTWTLCCHPTSLRNTRR
jgi:hypothetical protein